MEKALEEKQNWAKELRKSGRPLTVFSGGSTTAFQFDSELLKTEYGLSTVNVGLHAGAGLSATVAIASAFLEEGDLLILTSEPEMLSKGAKHLTKLGNQLIAVTDMDGDMFIPEDVEGFGFSERMSSLRPDLYHTTTMIGKLVTGRNLYRYSSEDLHRSGLITTPLRIDHSKSSTALRDHHLTNEGRNFLQELKTWAQERGISIAYMMPAYFTPEERLDEQKAINREFLAQVSEVIRVIRDPLVGTWSDPDDFSDTAMHFTESAARKRTHITGKALTR